jgi:plastocyanin
VNGLSRAGRRLPAGCLLALALSASLGVAASLAGDTHRVVMKAVDYEPKRLTVKVGEAVEWANGDIVAHTATARDRSWDVSVLPGRNGRMVMKSPGNVSYFCRYHPNMRGEIDVVP